MYFKWFVGLGKGFSQSISSSLIKFIFFKELRSKFGSRLTMLKCWTIPSSLDKSEELFKPPITNITGVPIAKHGKAQWIREVMTNLAEANDFNNLSASLNLSSTVVPFSLKKAVSNLALLTISVGNIDLRYSVWLPSFGNLNFIKSR